MYMKEIIKARLYYIEEYVSLVSNPYLQSFQQLRKGGVVVIVSSKSSWGNTSAKDHLFLSA